MDGGDKHSEAQTSEQQAAPQNNWQYQPETTAAPDLQSEQPAASEVAWTASEFVAHQKGTGWYVTLGFIGLTIASGVYIVAHDVFSVFVIGTLAAIIGVAASRQPRVMNYRLNRSGLSIGKKFYPYGSFRSFSVVEEGAFASITFMPGKRFMPSASVYFAPEDEKRIVEVLSRHLPMQPAPRDLFDNILRRVRF